METYVQLVDGKEHEIFSVLRKVNSQLEIRNELTGEILLVYPDQVCQSGALTIIREDNEWVMRFLILSVKYISNQIICLI